MLCGVREGMLILELGIIENNSAAAKTATTVAPSKEVSTTHVHVIPYFLDQFFHMFATFSFRFLLKKEHFSVWEKIICFAAGMNMTERNGNISLTRYFYPHDT